MKKMVYGLCVLSAALLIGNNAVSAPKKAEAVLLTPEGQKALVEYTNLLESLRAELKLNLPKIDPAKEAAFLAAHKAEKGTVRVKKDKNGKKREERKSHQYNNPKTAFAAVEAARPLLADLDAFLGRGAIDHKLVQCAVLANATPRGLAAFVQQGADEKKLIDELLGDTKLMKEMLYAGGAKAGRYGKAMQIVRSIESASERAATGHFRRLAIGAGLELAAPELCGYTAIDPVKRYQFFEQAYLAKALDSEFDKLTIWQYRQVINEPNSEEDMAWLREMLGNYRPDMITAPEGYRARYVGLMNSEFGHKRPEWDENASTSKIQQTIDKGGQCGPKAFFGRCLSRSFGVPTWGARLRSHTAMSYWTPKGWTTILGVSWRNGFWTSDIPDSMRAVVFKLIAMARDYPDAYVKACRAQWVGDVLEEERVSGMYSGTGGLWNALALNAMRATVIDKTPVGPEGKRPWEEDSYPKEAAKHPELMMKPVVTDADRNIVVDTSGAITVPSVACVSPATNTAKIVFMKSLDGGMQLHYKRWQVPEPFTYEVSAPTAGNYALSAKVVTVNQDQFFMLMLNGANAPVKVNMPYTVGAWGRSEPVNVQLVKGKNTLSFTRTAPEGFKEKGWQRAGPEYGGVTIKEFTLTPLVP